MTIEYEDGKVTNLVITDKEKPIKLKPRRHLTLENISEIEQGLRMVDKHIHLFDGHNPLPKGTNGFVPPRVMQTKPPLGAAIGEFGNQKAYKNVILEIMRRYKVGRKVSKVDVRAHIEKTFDVTHLTPTSYKMWMSHHFKYMRLAELTRDERLFIVISKEIPNNLRKIRRTK